MLVYLFLAAGQISNTPAELDLIKAIKGGSLAAVEKAVAAGANVNTRVVATTKPSLSDGNAGGKPYLAEPVLILAIAEERSDAAKFLLRKGADPNLKNEDGWTPLMNGSRSTKPFVAMLIAAKAKVNTTNGYGETALTYACNYGPISNIKQLLDAGADPNIGTPLRTAIQSDNAPAVRLLLKHGANPNQVIYGQTAYEMALLDSNAEIIKALREAGGKGRPLAVLRATREKEVTKWDKERALQRKKEEVKRTAAPKAELNEDDKVLISLLVDDIGKQKEVNWSGGKKKVFLTELTREAGSFESDGRWNGELSDRAVDVTLPLRKMLHERNVRAISLKGKLDPSIMFLPSEKLELTLMRENKLWVSAMLPGYSVDRKTAVLRFAFGPTPHGANGTYLFKRMNTGWTIAWRDYAYYA